MVNMKKIMILTSLKTGSGHKSSANAIEKKLVDAGYDTRQINVFELMGTKGRMMENSYIPLTTHHSEIYFTAQRFSEYFPGVIHRMMYLMVRRGLLEKIKEYEPDLIISVQCMFTAAISRIIRKYELNIPFYVGVIDLVDPPNVWKDKSADMTFVPTEKIREEYLSCGFDEDKVLVSGFPVRDDIIVPEKAKKIKDRINILMVNSSTDLDKNIRFLEEVSKLKNVKIDFICGLDKKLYETLTQMKEKGQIREDVNIHDFVNNMNEFMANSHIIMTKAGPNVIIESIRSGTAIVISGHIHGQEDNNYKYVVDNGYGIKCEDPEKIYEVLNDFIGEGKLEKCLENIAEHEISNGAEFIADYVKEHL